jgi:hypothetical protein
MLILFFQSIIRYIRCFAEAFLPKQRAHAPLHFKRLLFLLLCPLFLGVQILHWIGFLIDALLFPSYRKVKVYQPIFITGIPRSGTTFTHRTLASEEGQFTTVSTWEAALAPSITAQKIVHRFAALDRKVGTPIAKCIRAITQRGTKDFHAIHAVSPEAPEEDYLWLLPASSCLILLLAFPHSTYLAQMAALDTLPERQRERLLDYYESCIQRHLYLHGHNRRFLSKNAAFASWCSPLRKRFPDAKYIICVREPSEALNSQLNSLAPARKLFGTDPSGALTSRLFLEIFVHNYSTLSKFTESLNPKDMALIDQGDLRENSGMLLLEALRQIDIVPSSALRKKLNQLPRQNLNKAQLNPSDVVSKFSQMNASLSFAYRSLMNSSNRTKLPTNVH